MGVTGSNVASVALGERYRVVRHHTEDLAAPLSAEDQVVQSMPDVSPTKWHRAHVTWFFENFLLMPHLPGYEPVDPVYRYLFNSYYEAVGERHPRPARGLITRPGVAEILAYRAHVDEGMYRLVDEVIPHRPDLVALVELGLHHEQQHQELMLMDIKHVFSSTIVRPAYGPTESPDRGCSGLGPEGVSADGSSPDPVRPVRWLDVDGGIVTVGHRGNGFHFDNEAPCHQVLLRPFRLADRLVTCGEWLEFMAAGGYARATLWLSDGWRVVNEQGWDAPLYWRWSDDGWLVHTLEGERPVDAREPVVHVSYYEADAFARWAEARLPTEFEWEAAAGSAPVPSTGSKLHPTAATGLGLRQLYGDVWQWTSSAYAPYPGFRPAEGAVGEYNGKFMIDQQVLRGGSAATPAGHTRPTYRNFFPAGSRWQFGGLRLAGDGA